ncbi:hypothetical protein BT69DRAFT_171086 [Atractiella rhizophila]|nr:hypothetical protein BT69DRAFT_171086 [Atractiella rhizophila]
MVMNQWQYSTAGPSSSAMRGEGGGEGGGHFNASYAGPSSSTRSEAAHPRHHTAYYPPDAAGPSHPQPLHHQPKQQYLPEFAELRTLYSPSSVRDDPPLDPFIVQQAYDAVRPQATIQKPVHSTDLPVLKQETDTSMNGLPPNAAANRERDSDDEDISVDQHLHSNDEPSN